MVGPIEQGRILGSQDERELAQAGRGGLEMGGQDGIGSNGLGIEEAIGSFEHGRVVGGLGQGGGGLTGEGGSEVNEAFGAAGIAQVSITEFDVCPRLIRFHPGLLSGLWVGDGQMASPRSIVAYDDCRTYVLGND